MKSWLDSYMRVILAAIAVTALGAVAVTLQRSTIIDGRVPAAVFAALSAVGAVFLRGAFSRALRIPSRLIAAISGGALMWTATLCMFYSANYLFTRPASTAEYEAVITRKYTEQRYRTYRVGRRGGSRRVPYTAHCIDVQLPQGRVKTYTLTASQYIKARRGQRLHTVIEQGLFGIPVVKDISLPGQKPKSSH